MENIFDISIIICNYNNGKFLEKAINSALRQKNINIEIICVDDGCTDNSINVINQYSLKNLNFTAIVHSNRGLAASRNRALILARGKYIQFLDADDWLEDNACKKIYDFLELHNLDMCSFSGWNIDNGKKVENSYWEYSHIPPTMLNRGLSPYEFKDVIYNIPVSSCLSVYKKSFLNKINNKFDEGYIFEDNLFFYNAFFKAKKYAILKEKLYLRRLHENQITKRKDKSIFDIFYIYTKCFELFSKFLGKRYANLYAKRKMAHISFLGEGLDKDLRTSWIEETCKFIMLVDDNTLKNKEILLWDFETANKLFQNQEYLSALKKYITLASSHLGKNNNFIFHKAIAIKKLKQQNKSNFIIKASENNFPKISIIIPLYNKEHFVASTIDSIFRQTLKQVQIIVIDDGSTDNSLLKIIEMAEKCSNISVLYQNNSGAGVARNWGLEFCRGEYILFLDADDYYPHLDTLQMLYEKAIINKANILGGSLFEDIHGKINKVPFEKDLAFAKEGWMNFKEYQYDYGFTRFIYSRKFLNEYNIKFPELRSQEDPVFLIRALHKAGKFYALTDETYVYRKKHEAREITLNILIDIFKGYEIELEFSDINNYSLLHRTIINRLNKPFIIEKVKGFKDDILLTNQIRKTIIKINKKLINCHDMHSVLDEAYYNYLVLQ